MAPSDSDIENFTIFTGADEHTAKIWLDRYGAIDIAASQYFDHGGSLPDLASQVDISGAWDETMFEADRDAVYHGPPNIGEVNRALTIYGDDTVAEAKHRNTPEQDTGTIDTRPPDASDRQRHRQSDLALLRPSGGNFLAPLLTMLHEIPAARDALVGRQAAHEDHTPDPEWWKVRYVYDDAVTVEKAHIYREAQRIMAFLDSTRRAYGPIAPLEKLVGMISEAEAQKDSSVAVHEEFLRLWTEANAELPPEQSKRDIFTSHVVGHPSEGGTVEHGIQSINMEYDSVVADTDGTLIHALENMLTAFGTREHPGSFTHCADVLVLFPNPSDAKTPLQYKIPEYFHSGILLGNASSAESAELRHRKHVVQQALRSSDERRKSHASVTKPSGTHEFVISDLLKDMLGFYKRAEEARGTADVMQVQTTGEHASDEDGDNVLRLLDEAKSRIDHKLAEIEEHKQMAIKDIQDLNETLAKLEQKKIDEAGADGKGSTYWLQGVALSSRKFFIRIGRKDPEDLLTTLDWEWWKFEVSWYSNPANETFNLQASRKVFADVAQAAKESKDELMLIYASEDSLTYVDMTLPDALKDFVDADNMNFDAELNLPVLEPRVSPSSTAAEYSPGDDAHMIDTEGMIRLDSRDEENIPWGGVYSGPSAPVAPMGPIHIEDTGKTSNTGIGAESSLAPPGSRNQPPALPPRITTATASSTPVSRSSSSVTAGSKRKTLLTGIKNTLSRSKSRERSRGRDARTSTDGNSSGNNDLLVDNEEQGRGIPAMSSYMAGGHDGPGPAKRR